MQRFNVLTRDDEEQLKIIFLFREIMRIGTIV
jgi:hypothetical protein